MPRWEPDKSHEDFVDWCVEQRGQGLLWRAIAKKLNIGFSTLYEWFLRHPDLKKQIADREPEEVDENIRQTLIEVALKNKNVVALIFLHKARLKMYDVPPKVADEPHGAVNEPLYPPMTQEEWRRQHELRQKAKAK